ncbi:phosphoribosylanthranilate isomerase [Atopomonas sediminilitoris]|uniref:phosphoribosylanthranilate isomerase n=1 Tax=Atopomonas sediminilitoris TaxID=2919919 RepID=UPI001F4DF4D6|nr:phosphoribosylanthranilate isomerase [Atopomonas sediminilitoris]MCJ8168793.1 phosphoribosylanthranilate isomerase [Atopomonas sediminilitoris]
MMPTRVKMCGITRLEDALAAVQAGADALGFVFYRPSPRYIAPEQARAILRELPPFVTTVGLFVDAPRCEVLEILELLPLDVLQFHGDEVAGYCQSFDRPYLKALRVRSAAQALAQAEQHPAAQGVLLDAYVEGVPGGTGQAFDWSQVPALEQPLILAGGLNADNVAAAIAQVRPYAVDVSGGIEAAKGIKDADKMQQFMAQVRLAGRLLQAG